MINVAASLALAFSAATQLPPAQWTAMSTTAMGITGDLTTTPASFSFGHHTFRVGPAQSVRFDAYGDERPTSAIAYPVSSPSNPLLRGRNRLCQAPVRWVVTWRTADGDLGLSASSAQTPPNGVSSLKNCGTFTYSAEQP